MKDYYYILGIDKNSTQGDIKKAYKKLSIKFHPDKNSGDKFFESMFKEIQEAYEIISNENRRIIYDKQYETYKNTSDKSEQTTDMQILDFYSDKINVINGEVVKFNWKCLGAKYVRINLSEHKLPPIGNKSIVIKAPKTVQKEIVLKAYGVNNIEKSKSIIISIIEIKKYSEAVPKNKIVKYLDDLESSSEGCLSETIVMLITAAVFFVVFYIIAYLLR